MEHLASRRKTWYLISLAIILPGVLSLIFFGLNRGIEFTGGTLWELEFNQTVDTETLTNVLIEHGVDAPKVQSAANSAGEANRVAVIRMKELQQGSDQKKALETAINAGGRSVHRARTFLSRIKRESRHHQTSVLRGWVSLDRHPGLYRIRIPQYPESRSVR